MLLNVTANREYKSRIFAMIFHHKKELLELYNAVNGTNYTDPEQLEITTLENAIYLSMNNDVSFVIDLRLNLYEHQSTYNPNIPLRLLFYISDEYSGLTRNVNLYGRKLIMLPTPRFLVFYNGVEKRPEREDLKLSTAFWVKDADPSLELKVTVLNINPGYNENLKKACKSLADYCEYSRRVREYAAFMDTLEEAVERAVDECIQEGILADFLRKNRAEAIKVSIYEYDEERTLQMIREEGKEEGWEEGKEEGREEGRKEGNKEGEARMANLVVALSAAGRTADIQIAAVDPEYRRKLYKEFQIP